MPISLKKCTVGIYITILIVLATLVYMIVYYSSLFQYFLLICYRPNSSWKFLIFLYTSLFTFFPNINIIWWTHTFHIKSYSAACPSYINSCLKVKYPLHISDSYAQPVTQQYESKSVWKYLCTQSSHYENMNSAARPC